MTKASQLPETRPPFRTPVRAKLAVSTAERWEQAGTWDSYSLPARLACWVAPQALPSICPFRRMGIAADRGLEHLHRDLAYSAIVRRPRTSTLPVRAALLGDRSQRRSSIIQSEISRNERAPEARRANCQFYDTSLCELQERSAVFLFARLRLRQRGAWRCRYVAFSHDFDEGLARLFENRR
jgi:hypothetical protein